MTLKVEVDPGYGSTSARGRFTDLEGSETVPLLIPVDQHQEYIWKPLSKEELQKCAGGPEWRKFRSRLVLCFWIGWLIMLGTAIAIIIQSPRIPSPSLHWWQKGVFYRLQPALFMDADSVEVSHISSKFIKTIYSSNKNCCIYIQAVYPASILKPKIIPACQSLSQCCIYKVSPETTPQNI